MQRETEHFCVTSQGIRTLVSDVGQVELMVYQPTEHT